MIGSRWPASFFALAVSMAGCGGSTVLETTTGGGTGAGTGTMGLVGIWNGSATFGQTTLTERLTLDGDGTATATDTFAVTGSGACTGALVIQDTWTSTSSTISVTGGTCSGQVSCPNGTTTPCGMSESVSETCSYVLSNGGDTLVLTCPEASGPITFTRGN